MSKEIRDAIITSATEQFRSLFEAHFASIAKAATETFIDDEKESEPRAKVAVNIEFDALAQAPTVIVKLGWSARYKDESEQTVDPLQSKLEMGGAE